MLSPASKGGREIHFRSDLTKTSVPVMKLFSEIIFLLKKIFFFIWHRLKASILKEL